ncbi:hypothetical protein OPU71_10295 [Niveibacterium sp. 24ML]|uniref:hypothetical protein n=1 Tax=Niveibacterium sp. 24ML TaxID=2985512 RepID=UPI0022702CA4|nr:hypothetical protein [Niveibacterium sp. 24ML]MCX9156511.1 hypothetical protein [Niveibacterium sp. 24ML]
MRYGRNNELIPVTEAEEAIVGKATMLLDQAIKLGKVEPRYNMYYRKEGIKYRKHRKFRVLDISKDGNDVLFSSSDLLQGKYYTSSRNTRFFLLRKRGRSVQADYTSAQMFSYLDRCSDYLGDIIEMLIEKLKITPPARVRKGYKVVVRDKNGRLRSVYDGSLWTRLRWRNETAKRNAGSGFYYFRNADDAIRSASKIPDWNVKDLVLVEVEAGGAEFRVSENELRCSYLRTTKIVGCIADLQQKVGASAELANSAAQVVSGACSAVV